MSPIEAVIWDLGGVIARTHDRSGREGWEARLGLEQYGLERTVFGGEISSQATIGQANREDVWAAVGERFQLDQHQLSELQDDFWRGDSIDQRLVDFIRGLRSEYKTGMITNAWPEIRSLIEDEWRIADAFQVIVVSAEVALAKPDPAIYQLALEQLGVAAPASIFVDDMAANLEAAQALGMQPIQFKDTEQAITAVQAMLSEAKSS